MTPLQLEGVLRGHVVLLQQVSLLRVQGVAVGDGGCDGHLVVWVLLIHNAVVEQQPAVGLGAAPCKHRLPCTNSNQSFHSLQTQGAASCLYRLPYTNSNQSFHLLQTWVL